MSPCISLLRQLATQVNSTLGARLGTKHQPPELKRDLETLSSSMRERGVFRMQPGRELQGVRDGEVPNVVTAGFNQLLKPLEEYNETFRQLQCRRRGTPIADIPLDGEISTPAADVRNPELVCASFIAAG